MKRLHLFLIKEFLGPFITTFFIAIFILLMQFLWKYIDDLVGKGLEINQVIQLLFYASARFVPLALPIAMLLSSVMLFGKLGENNELAALKSSGISFIRLLLPLTILVSIISYGSFLFSNYVMPIANLKNGSMIYDIQKKKPALNIKEGVFYKAIEGYSIKISEKDTDGKKLHDIIIYDHTSTEGNINVIVAQSGVMQVTNDEKFLELTLYNGHAYTEIKDKKKKNNNIHRTTHFKEDIIRFDLSSFNKKNKSSEKLYKGHYAMLNNKQIEYALDSLNEKLNNKIAENKQKINDNYHQNIITNNIKYKSNIEIKKQHYNIAINKLRTLKSVTKSYKESIEYQNIIITKHKIEWHRKISLAIACILLFLTGAPLGAIMKKGGFGIPVIISVFFFIIYQELNTDIRGDPN